MTSTQAPFALRGRNPDVLTSIANLSNDEVFTPPEFANRMLDTLAEAWAKSNDGANIWADSTVTFLDPFTKSGVFLREITKRLVEGLEREIPNLQERVNHVLTKQVFGIGITELTSLLARRSVYCSKWANGEHSICTAFDNEQGNIWFERTEHTWVGGIEKVITMDDNGEALLKPTNGKCKFCGANQKEYDRDDALESHAYAFIHTDDIKTRIAELFGEEMKFDVIIGNPPYQLDDGGYGTSAVPIYQKFVEQARHLEPRFLSMVIPARWFAGGKGLDDFRETMLHDDRLRTINDFPDSSDVFPGVQIKGGVCYFLWVRDTPGPVEVSTWDRGSLIDRATRNLLEPGADVFIRYNSLLGILRKVMAYHHGQSSVELDLPAASRFVDLVSSAKPFGFRTYFKGAHSGGPNYVKVYQNGGVGYAARTEVEKNHELIDTWKVFIPAAGSGSDAFPHPILGKPFVGEPGSVCSETYNAIGPFGSREEAQSVISYIQTRLFRLLVLAHKSSQHANRNVYTFVPTQPFDRLWSDEALIHQYQLSEAEVDFMRRMVRQSGEQND